MIVLGISHDLWISSAAIVINGKVKAAIAEERLNRIKKYKGFPTLAVRYCLHKAGIKIDQVDLIVNGWNPAWYLEALNTRYSSQSRWRAEYLYSIPNNIISIKDNFNLKETEQNFKGLGPKIKYIDHHLAHAAGSYYLSDYKNALFLVADGRGERHTATYGTCNNNKIKVLDTVNYPNSLGLFYSTITQFLGFIPDSDEWKVMALASLGTSKKNKFYKKISKIINVDKDGKFRINLDYFGFHQPDVFGNKFYSEEFKKLVGISPRKPDRKLMVEHKNLAWACQKVFEETFFKILNKLHRQYKKNNLILSGGCFMNSVLNGKVLKNTPFKKVFIGPCPDDSGISVGSAIWGYYNRNPNSKRQLNNHNYWGPEYKGQAEVILKKFKIKYSKLTKPWITAAELLNKGKIIGWYQGRAEFGQRALGNRSILADPRNPENKELVNKAVKYRESFRPFAPAILNEDIKKYFISEDEKTVKFMEKVFQFKSFAKSKVPAVVHVDGSGRLQTVDAKSNKKFYLLIKHFKSLSGVPIILNTSFNLNGEPIVCNPNDAIRTFFSCGLDCLIIEDFLISK